MGARTFWKAAMSRDGGRGFRGDLFRVAILHREDIDELIIRTRGTGDWNGMPAVLDLNS